MSNNFLSLRIPKALVLSDTSALDTPLTIAHMQGKFKLIVKNNVGHFIHEDDPKGFYDLLKDFVHVFQIVGKVKDIKKITSKLGDQTKIIKYVEFKG